MINHFHSRGKKLIKFHFLRKKLHNIITLLFSGTTWFLSLSLSCIYWQLQDYFLGRSIKNINYTKFKTKKKLNTSTSQKIQKKKTKIHKVLQLFSTIFYILKSLHDIFVINSRAVNGSGQVGFGPNPDSTRQLQVEGEGTQNRPPEKSIELISGEGEHRSVRSVAKVNKIIEIWEKKCRRNLENLAGIYFFCWNPKFFTENC